MYPSIEKIWSDNTIIESSWWAEELQNLLLNLQNNTELLERIEGKQLFRYEHLLAPSAPSSIRVLDLGAGPITTLGSVSRSHQIAIDAVDPLSQKYIEILDRCGIIPKWRVRYATAEHLDAIFGEDTFDFAQCRNALDHAIDPFRGIWQTIRVLKQGAAFFLHGSENEGVKQNYQGLHQWNFEVREQHFYLWRPGIEINVGEALKDVLKVESAIGEGWYRIVLRKVG
ncbi:class I SAM-dependent methyltransferase [Methylorubrum populi]|uniref:Methyltransferase type 11 domain-containing protein n=1 Tax=Methylorubrum populi TaxID=223967 RepID=A0A833MY20_9HYPH|nr:class I SAM-dependent methyltransferase [Methylorubrum populi]KAB7783821.1 hypothetical protein F8B43_3744 [Methylorubrum populi]